MIQIFPIITENYSLTKTERVCNVAELHARPAAAGDIHSAFLTIDTVYHRSHTMLASKTLYPVITNHKELRTAATATKPHCHSNWGEERRARLVLWWAGLYIDCIYSILMRPLWRVRLGWADGGTDHHDLFHKQI